MARPLKTRTRWVLSGIAIAAAVIIAVAVFVVLRNGATTPSVASLSNADRPSFESAEATASLVAGPTKNETARAGDPVSAGASGSGAASSVDEPTLGGSPPAEGGSPQSLGTVPADAVAVLDVALDGPQTYLCDVSVLGWKSLDDGVAALRVVEAELLGPIDPTTGEPQGTPGLKEPDHAGRLRALSVLTATTAAARADLDIGTDATVRIVLVPAGDQVRLVLDRVE